MTLVPAGITLHEALATRDSLKSQGPATRVVDASSVKPLDVDTLRETARDAGGALVVEHHVAAAGLGEAAAGAIGALAPVYRRAVPSLPCSGTKDRQLDRHGISRDAIAAAVTQSAA